MPSKMSPVRFEAYYFEWVSLVGAVSCNQGLKSYAML